MVKSKHDRNPNIELLRNVAMFLCLLFIRISSH